MPSGVCRCCRYRPSREVATRPAARSTARCSLTVLTGRWQRAASRWRRLGKGAQRAGAASGGQPGSLGGLPQAAMPRAGSRVGWRPGGLLVGGRLAGGVRGQRVAFCVSALCWGAAPGGPSAPAAGGGLLAETAARLGLARTPALARCSVAPARCPSPPSTTAPCVPVGDAWWWRRRLRRRPGAYGVGLMLTGLAPGVAAVAATQALAGTGNAAEVVATDTIVQRVVPRPLPGRGFGAMATPPSPARRSRLWPRPRCWGCSRPAWCWSPPAPGSC